MMVIDLFEFNEKELEALNKILKEGFEYHKYYKEWTDNEVIAAHRIKNKVYCMRAYSPENYLVLGDRKLDLFLDMLEEGYYQLTDPPYKIKSLSKRERVKKIYHSIIQYIEIKQLDDHKKPNPFKV